MKVSASSFGSPEISALHMKFNGAIDLLQIVCLESELLKQGVEDLDRQMIVESIDRILRNSNAASTLVIEARKETESLLLR